MTGKDIAALMRRHKITIKEFSKRTQITQKRVREVRRDGLADPETARDWVQAITGADPGPTPAAEPIATVADEDEPAVAKSTSAAEDEPAPAAERSKPHSPPLLLPANLAALAKLADPKSEHSSKPFAAGVRLQATDNGYRAAVTDGHVLAIVTGDCTEAAKHYPSLAALASAPNGAAAATVPARDWKRAFADLPAGRLAQRKPVLANVAAVLSEQETTLASTDLDKESVMRARNLDCRYPAFDRVIPTDAPAFRVSVDARKLAELLQVASAFADGYSANRVTLEFFTPEKPFVVRTDNPEGQQFLGLLVPLTQK